GGAGGGGPGPGDEVLARTSRGPGGHRLVEQRDARVGEGPADRHRPLAPPLPSVPGQAGDRRLRRAIFVAERRSRQPAFEAIEEVPPQPLASAEDGAEGGRSVERGLLEQEIEERGNEAGDGDALVPEGAGAAPRG